MGTNFYIRGRGSNDDSEYHIGKRSAAGLYCWDCGITLCKGGESEIHSGHSEWYDECPKCGQKPAEERLETSSAGRELGFNKSPPAGKTGVRSASSFAWGIQPSQLPHVAKEAKICPTCQKPFDDDGKVIEDEYGNLFTMEDFINILDECPIRRLEMVGRWFS